MRWQTAKGDTKADAKAERAEVEVLSPATGLIDRSTKRQLYARHGVPFCWLVDPEGRAIEALGLGPDGLTSWVSQNPRSARSSANFGTALRGGGIVISPSFPATHRPGRDDAQERSTDREQNGRPMRGPRSTSLNSLPGISAAPGRAPRSHDLRPLWKPMFQDGVSAMATTVDRVLGEALKLPPDERARIVAELLASLEPDVPSDRRTEAEWIDEIERRARAAIAGNPGVP